MLLLSPFTPSQSCGPDIMPNEGRFCVFRPEMGQKAAWTPFFYSEEWLNSYTADPEDTDYRRNIREWLTYLNTPVEESDVYELLYLTDPDDFLYAHETGNWEKLETNTFVQFLRKPENQAVMTYMLNAKQNEFIQQRWTDEYAWGDLAGKDLNLVENYQQKTEALMEKTTDAFLKQRYAFLLIRASWDDSQKYSSDVIKAGKDVRSIYNQYLKGKNTIVADWANIYIAPFYLENCDTLRYHYALLNAFDKTEEKKVAAYTRMYKKWLPDLLTFVPTPHEKAVVYTLMSLRNPGKALHELKSASKLDPQLSYLPLLITREINKLEDWLLSPSVLNFDSFLWQEQYNYETDQYEVVYEKNREKDLEYLRMFRSFLETLRPSAALPGPYLQNAIAHLYILEGNFEKAKKALNEISPQSAPEFLIQKNIEKIICTAHLADITSPETKEILAKDLKALEKSYKALYPEIKPKNEYEMRYYQDEGRDEWKDDMDELYVWLCRLYQEKGETVTAGLLYMKAKILVNEYDGGGYYSMDYYEEDGDTVMANLYYSIAYPDRYASPEQIDEWMKLKHSPQKTAFEKYISPEKWTSDEMLLDLKGTILIRLGRYEEACNTFARLPEDFWEKTYEFKHYLPATSIRYSPILPYNEEESGKKMKVSKARIAKELRELSEAVKKPDNPDIAKAWYDFGLALYNITYDGNAWMMFSYGKSSRELGDDYWSDDCRFAFYDFEPNATRYREEYYGGKKASDAFQKAYTFAQNNPELAAKANVMMYVCAMESYQNLVAASVNYDAPVPDVPARTKLLKYQLKKKFSGTRTYEILSSNCLDFEE